jgi:hypothetical protein
MTEIEKAVADERERLAKWHDAQAIQAESDRIDALQLNSGPQATWAYHRAGAHTASARYIRSLMNV